jgi:hypothetical protein
VARFDPDDPGERPGLPREVAHERGPVADHDGLLAEFAGLHGGDGLALDLAGVPAAVDGGDEALAGVLVLGADLGARPGPAGRPDAYVVLVPLVLGIEVGVVEIRVVGIPARLRH